MYFSILFYFSFFSLCFYLYYFHLLIFLKAFFSYVSFFFLFFISFFKVKPRNQMKTTWPRTGIRMRSSNMLG